MFSLLRPLEIIAGENPFDDMQALSLMHGEADLPGRVLNRLLAKIPLEVDYALSFLAAYVLTVALCEWVLKPIAFKYLPLEKYFNHQAISLPYLHEYNNAHLTTLATSASQYKKRIKKVEPWSQYATHSFYLLTALWLFLRSNGKNELAFLAALL